MKQTAAKNAINLLKYPSAKFSVSKLKETVEFNFNDVNIIVTANDSVKDVLDQFNRKMDEQRRVYENSAEGKEAKRKQQLELEINQFKC